MENNIVSRLNTAVKFLKDGQTFKVGEFVLGVIDSHSIFVNFYSNFYFIQNLSKEKAIEEFHELKSEFQNLINKANDFSSFLKNKTIEYNLVIDTGGGSIDVCKEKNGVLELFI